MSWPRDLDLAIEAAFHAGEHLVRLLKEEKEVLSNEGRDIKLQADRDAEKLIVDHLRAHSDHALLAEEGGEYGRLDAREGPFWVIDPLDGTLNFSRSLPVCCVSIALMDRDGPQIGVIYDFNRDELFKALRGEGAWLNGRPIRTSGRTEANQAVLATGLSAYGEHDEASMRRFIQVCNRFKKPRALGSAAISLAWVACGRLDAYAENDIMLWDVAAGWALVEAAGGYADVRVSPASRWARHVRIGATEALWRD